MPFTTWADLYSQMLDDLASGNWRTQEYRIGQRARTFTSWADFKSMLAWVKTQAEAEAGTFSPRTYARRGGI